MSGKQKMENFVFLESSKTEGVLTRDQQKQTVENICDIFNDLYFASNPEITFEHRRMKLQELTQQCETQDDVNIVRVVVQRLGMFKELEWVDSRLRLARARQNNRAAGMPGYNSA